MALDPQMQAILNQAAAAGGKPFNSMSPVEARQAIDVMFGAFRGNPAEVGRVEDRKLPGPAGEVPVRIYSPPGRGPFGVLIFFHGGGWVIGNIGTHDSLCRDLTKQANIVTISVEYRLAPEHKFPAGPEDCYAVTKWVGANTALLSVDPDKLAVGGDSAGGNLAAAVTLMARDRGGPKIAYQALIYPATNAANDTPSQREFGKDGYILSKSDMEWFYGHYLKPGDATNPYAESGSHQRSERIATGTRLNGGLRSVARRGRSLWRSTAKSRCLREDIAIRGHVPRLRQYGVRTRRG